MVGVIGLGPVLVFFTISSFILIYTNKLRPTVSYGGPSLWRAGKVRRVPKF